MFEERFASSIIASVHTVLNNSSSPTSQSGRSTSARNKSNALGVIEIVVLSCQSNRSCRSNLNLPNSNISFVCLFFGALGVF
jgi:hypothetical protein